MPSKVIDDEKFSPSFKNFVSRLFRHGWGTYRLENGYNVAVARGKSRDDPDAVSYSSQFRLDKADRIPKA